MFNLVDIAVIAIILFSVFVGYKKGFIRAAISLVSFFVAIGVALMFYKPLAVILTENTLIDDWIIENISAIGEKTEINYEKTDDIQNSENEFDQINNVETAVDNTENISNNNEINDTENEEDKISEKNILQLLEYLPTSFITSFDIDEIKNSAKEEISYKISEHIMNLMSLIVIYVVVKVTLTIAAVVLNGIMQIPVLKQINEILGMVLGAVLGFIQIYIAFAVITFVSSICDISNVIEMIKISSFARILFENNLIINLLF